MSSKILDILNEIESDSKRTHKLAVIEKNKNNDLFKKVLQAALDPYTQYYIRKIPLYTWPAIPSMTLCEALVQLKRLSAREMTGHAAINHLTNILSAVHSDDAVVIERIIGKDLRCGAADSTVNTIIPGLIPTFDVMLSHKDISGIRYPAIVQCKLDGARCHLYFDGNTATAFSRSGNEFQLLGALNDSAREYMKPFETWDGELVFFKNGKALERKASNGLANKANRGTISQAEADMVVFTVWDIVDFTGTIPYKDRFENLTKRFVSTNKFQLVESEIANSADEVATFYERMRIAGQEGCIAKNISAGWEPKRTKNLGKVKAEEEGDLKVTGWNEGTGKYAGFMGSLVCETSDQLLEVNVSGWSDDDRKTLTEANTRGRILTVRYNTIIDNKVTGKKSLFLPRAVEFRFDKTVANTISELK